MPKALLQNYRFQPRIFLYVPLFQRQKASFLDQQMVDIGFPVLETGGRAVLDQWQHIDGVLSPKTRPSVNWQAENSSGVAR